MTGDSISDRLPRILIAECNHELCSLLKHILQRAAYAVQTCSSRSELFSTLGALGGDDSQQFDLLLFDKRVLDQQAVTMIHDLQQRQGYPPLVLIGGWYAECDVQLDELDVAAVVDPPADVAKFRTLIRQIVPHRPTE